MAGREKVQAQGRLDGGAIEPLGPGPVELAHGSEPPDPRVREAAFQTAAGAVVLLRVDEMLQQLDGAPAAFGGERDEIAEMGGGVTEAEGLEGVIQRGHRSPPDRSPPAPRRRRRR